MSTHSRLRSAVRCLLAGLSLAALTPTAAEAGTPVVRLFPVFSELGGITAGPDGAIWVTDRSLSSALRRLDANGNLRSFNTVSLGASPAGITAGPDGNLWFTEFSRDQIGRLGPDTGVMDEFSAGLKNGAAPTSIVTGSDGNLWFVESDNDAVGRITPSGVITEFPLSATGTDIAAGSDGSLWVAQQGGQTIERISAADGSSAGVFFFGISGAPSSIAAGPDGNLWFTEANGKIGRITPGGSVTEFTIPGVGTWTPSRIIAGPDGNLWFGDFSSRSIRRITPAGAITEFPTGLDSTETPCDLTAGSDGAVWFRTCGNFADPHHIGRISTGAAPPRYTDPATLAVPGSGTFGEANAYPATINVDGLQGTVTKVTVRLNGVHHPRSSDLGVALVGPQGQTSILMANATSRLGDAGTPPDALNGDVITFASDGVDPLRRLTSGIFKPFNPGFLLGFTAPIVNVPAPPASLNIFNGTSPNGDWKLYVVDDEASDDFAGNLTKGKIAGGWSLDVQTTGPSVEVPGPTTTVNVPGPTTTITVPGPVTQSDATAPVLTLGKLPSTLPLAALRKGVAVKVTASEAATLEASLNAKVGKATLTRRAPSSSPLELDAATVRAPAGAATTIRLKPSAKLLGRPTKPFTVEVRLRAIDGAGNAASLSRRITITLVKASRSRR